MCSFDPDKKGQMGAPSGSGGPAAAPPPPAPSLPGPGGLPPPGFKLPVSEAQKRAMEERQRRAQEALEKKQRETAATATTRRETEQREAAMLALQQERERLAQAVTTNPEHDWLTYESRFNGEKFRKLHVAVAYGLYTLPLDDKVEIVASQKIPDILVQVFFPGMTKDEILKLAAQTTRWRKPSAPGGAAVQLAAPAAQISSREAARARVVDMIMPYNILANDGGSCAIGSNLEGETKVGSRLKKTWAMWESASRSSVVKIEPLSSQDLQATQPELWSFRQPPDPVDGSLKHKPFKLSARLPHCFSIKTGVRWIGSVAQGSGDPGGGKDILESNALLASMRSDWVEFVESKIGSDPKLIVLRELLTVTYPNEPQALGKAVRDGYQIRDLAPLNPDRIYFPPLSIPYGGQAFVDAYNGKHPGAPKTFTDFWRTAYAEAVGAAKAKLLLRYGLQLTTPNPQNFLLEFDQNLEPTGAVVVRDIGDAKLHSEAITEILARIGEHEVLTYELNNPEHVKYLPAQTSNQGRVGDTQDHTRFAEYPLNTRMHWTQYSSFKDQYGGNQLPDKVLTTVEWGRAHNRKYVETLAGALALPDLAIPIYGDATYQVLLGDTADTPTMHQGKIGSARKILPELVAAMGSITKVDAAVWRGTRYGQQEITNCEWALEVFADEQLQMKLATPAGRKALNEKWGKWT